MFFIRKTRTQKMALAFNVNEEVKIANQPNIVKNPLRSAPVDVVEWWNIQRENVFAVTSTTPLKMSSQSIGIRTKPFRIRMPASFPSFSLPFHRHVRRLMI